MVDARCESASGATMFKEAVVVTLAVESQNLKSSSKLVLFGVENHYIRSRFGFSCPRGRNILHPKSEVERNM